MSFRKVILGVFAGLLTCFALQAQTFETRSTRYSEIAILQQMDTSATMQQLNIRDSVIEASQSKVGLPDKIETFYNGYHLGMVIYRNGNPHELLGFWDPQGNPIPGGHLRNGSGEVKTPFHPELIQNFKSETVNYVAGIKNGPVFYYCDCASVLRKGTFVNNQKSGLWKEFSPNGDFIKQEMVEIPSPPLDIIGDGIQKDWLAPAHCMMNPDDKCPDPKLK
jgi:antitoxin component YwqK of YwqJK toxin-antitoxin module